MDRENPTTKVLLSVRVLMMNVVYYWLLRMWHHMTSPGRRGRGRGLEDNGWGQEEEEEEEEEEQRPFHEDHVDVTNWLDLLNRSVTHPLPHES